MHVAATLRFFPLLAAPPSNFSHLLCATFFLASTIFTPTGLTSIFGATPFVFGPRSFDSSLLLYPRSSRLYSVAFGFCLVREASKGQGQLFRSFTTSLTLSSSHRSALDPKQAPLQSINTSSTPRLDFLLNSSPTSPSNCPTLSHTRRRNIQHTYCSYNDKERQL